VSTEREQQIREALAEQERLRTLDALDTDNLRERYDRAWKAVQGAMQDVEPILYTLIARRVRAVEPDATCVAIEPTDQGGPGWVYGGDLADLADDDYLAILLRDLGEFMSSEDHPAQDLNFLR
jgi:hypothetical protein